MKTFLFARAWFRTRGFRRWHKSYWRGVEPGLYELMHAPLEYGVCRCELGCECDDIEEGGMSPRDGSPEDTPIPEPREDVEALHEAIGPPHGDRAKAAAHIELDALLARLEQTKRELSTSLVNESMYFDQLLAAERALREIAEYSDSVEAEDCPTLREIARAALASEDGGGDGF